MHIQAFVFIFVLKTLFILRRWRFRWGQIVFVQANVRKRGRIDRLVSLCIEEYHFMVRHCSCYLEYRVISYALVSHEWWLDIRDTSLLCSCYIFYLVVHQDKFWPARRRLSYREFQDRFRFRWRKLKSDCILFGKFISWYQLLPMSF